METAKQQAREAQQEIRALKDAPRAERSATRSPASTPSTAARRRRSHGCRPRSSSCSPPRSSCAPAARHRGGARRRPAVEPNADPRAELAERAVAHERLAGRHRPRHAFHGPAGEFVIRTAPHTEADPMALLIQFLVAFGVGAGRHAYWPIEASRHHPNEFAVLVGPSSKGRQGIGVGSRRGRLCRRRPRLRWRRASSPA